MKQPYVVFHIGLFALVMTGCVNFRNGHGKIYVNGTVTQDVNGGANSTVTGGVEYNFVKHPKNSSGK